MASERTILTAIRLLTAEGFTISSPQSPSVTLASPPSPTARAPRVRQTAAQRSAAQPRVKHCGRCGAAGHNARTCSQGAEAAAPAPATRPVTIDMTSALLDGIITPPVKAAPKAAAPAKGLPPHVDLLF